MDERDEVVTEFDQTNDKAPGLEGDSDYDEELDSGDDLGPSAVGGGREGDDREPLATALVDDLTNGGSDEERRD
jgi:hypothetical protein